jgi:hypothetical protein
MQFKNYPSERLIIDSISSRLTEPERYLRLFLMEQIIQSGAPVNVNSFKHYKELQHLELNTIIDNLVSKNAIVEDSEGNINFVYPVSALPTNHNVVLKDGRTFHAMCAVDAMGTAFTFKQDIKISSKCAYCGETVTVEIKNEKITELHPASTHVLHVDLKKNDNWAGSC